MKSGKRFLTVDGDELIQSYIIHICESFVSSLNESNTIDKYIFLKPYIHT